jgi:hypothetical protein
MLEDSMNWKQYIKVFLRNTIITTAVITAILGLIGLLVGGEEGLIGGATWGLILSLVAVPFNGFVITSKYWGDYAGRFGRWWIGKESEGED